MPNLSIILFIFFILNLRQLYSKPGCCLCDGLKEQLQAGPNSIHVDLQVRDNTTNPEWDRAYQYETPVLRFRSEASPRLSPRLGVKFIKKKLAAAP